MQTNQTQPPETNALVRLLKLLPAEVAQQKRALIEADLVRTGKFEHYRQSVTKPGWNLASTQVACAAVLIEHLGVSLDFFTGSDAERTAQIEALVKSYYQAALSE